MEKRWVVIREEYDLCDSSEQQVLFFPSEADALRAAGADARGFLTAVIAFGEVVFHPSEEDVLALAGQS